MSWTGLEPTPSWRGLDQSEPVHAGLLLSSFSSLIKTCIYIAQLALLNPDNVHVQWSCSRKVVRLSQYSMGT